MTIMQKSSRKRGSNGIAPSFEFSSVKQAGSARSQLMARCSQLISSSISQVGRQNRVHGNLPRRSVSAMTFSLRKEVIQPQVLLRLPCYDFTPIMSCTLGGCLSCELAHRLLVRPTFVM